MKAEGEIFTDKIMGMSRTWIAVYPNVWEHGKESLREHFKTMEDTEWNVLTKDQLDSREENFKNTLMLVQDNDFVIYHDKNGISMRHDSPAWKMAHQRYFAIESLNL
jgi:hypothetical protein